MKKPSTTLATAGIFPSYLAPDLLNALESIFEFDQMTPVQASVIPAMVKEHKDVIVHSMTGSGKTLAFLLPILDRYYQTRASLRQNQVSSLVISPTRELASQIFSVAKRLLPTDLCESDLMLAIGGTDIDKDLERLTVVGAKIIIGTPGRILDVMNKLSFNDSSTGSGSLSSAADPISWKNLEFLILDEGDRLLDMGFETALSRIMVKLPKQRRTGLFSATMTDALDELARVGLRNPQRITVKHTIDAAAAENIGNSMLLDDSMSSSLQGQVDAQTPSSLNIYYLMSKAHHKLAHLQRFLVKEYKAGCKVMIYFATCASVDYHREILVRLPELAKMKIMSLHGRMVAKKRQGVMDSFVKSHAAVMLCTDVTARGVDIPEIDWVVQFDPPLDPKVFVHRCGRTARLGNTGQAVVYLQPNEDLYVEFLKVRKVPIQPFHPDNDDEQLEQLEEEATQLEHFIVKNLVVKDRVIFDAGKMAFIAAIRSYQEHQASFIFQLKKVDLCSLIRSFCLIQLPRMPELKDQARYSDWICPVPRELDFDTIPYKDKKREASRQVRLEKMRAECNQHSDADVSDGSDDDDDDGHGDRKKRPAPWSRNQEKKDKRKKRREAKQRKRDFLERSKKNCTNAAAGDEEEWDSQDEEDAQEMESEYRQLKQENKRARRMQQ